MKNSEEEEEEEEEVVNDVTASRSEVKCHRFPDYLRGEVTSWEKARM